RRRPPRRWRRPPQTEPARPRTPPRERRLSSYAEEVAALRGTRSATLKDLLTHPPFARLLAAMSVSSLGDWVGFTAVLALVSSRASPSAALGAVAAVMTARTLPAVLFRPLAG